MTNTTAADWPLRIARTTTGVVHAAREVEVEVLDFNAPTVAARHTGTYRTDVVKACGYEPNTMRRVAGTAGTDAEVTCRKCLKALA